MQQGIVLVVCLLLVTVGWGQETQVRLAPGLSGFTFTLPSWVYQPTATITVDAPAKAEALAKDKVITGTVELRHSTATERQLSLSVRLTPEYWDDKEKGTHVLSRWHGTVCANLGDWPDGDVAIELRIPGADAATWPLPITTLHLVRGTVARIPVATRAEFCVWLDHANDHVGFWAWQPTWPNIARAFTQPDHPYDGLRGFVLRSYPQPQLRRLQPYTLYIPEALDLTKPAPLLILLHGSGGNYLNIFGDYGAGERLEQSPMLIANAGMLRESDFRHPFTLSDVIGVLDDVSRKYHVDPDRVYLQGISLGGRGSLDLAALLPDRFAAISAQSPFGLDRATWEPVLMSEDDGTALRLKVKNDVRTLLPNLTRTPVEVLYGYQDHARFVAAARTVGALLKDTLKTDVVIKGFNCGHNLSLPDYDWATTRAWMLKYTKQHQPNEVRLRVTNLRFGVSAWVHVQALADYSRVGRIYAQYRPETKTLMLVTANVATATYAPPGDVQKVVLNGTSFSVNWKPSLNPLCQRAETLTTSNAPTPHDGKRPGLSGPIWDLWSRPVNYVYATTGTAKEQACLKQSAENAANWQDDIAYGDPHLPVVAENALTAAQKQENLVYFITPADVPRLLGHAAIWPLVYNKRQAGGMTPAAYLDADVRVALRPSQWAVDGYILYVVVAGQRPVNLQAINWDQWDLPAATDWLLLRTPAPTAPEEQRVATITAAGVYDNHWRPAAWAPFTVTTDETVVP